MRISRQSEATISLLQSNSAITIHNINVCIALDPTHMDADYYYQIFLTTPPHSNFNVILFNI